MKEKYLLFKDGRRERIIKEYPTIVNDKRWGCNTREYVVSNGDVYKQYSHPDYEIYWCKRVVGDISGEEYYVLRNDVDKVIEETSNIFEFALPEYCILHGKKCDHCSCETGGYCQARTHDPKDVFKALNKRIENLISRSGDQDKEIIELTEKVNKLEAKNEKLKNEVAALDKDVDDLTEENQALKQNAIDYLKDSCSKLKDASCLNGIISGNKKYIHIENLQILASKIREIVDENQKLKEQHKQYLFDVKSYLNNLYGVFGRPLYCCIGRKRGKTILVDMHRTTLKELEHRYAELEKENKKLKTLNQSIKLDNRYLLDENQKLKEVDKLFGQMSLGQFEELLEENKKIKAKHSKATKKIEEMKSQYTELESKYNSLDKQSTSMIQNLKKENQELKVSRKFIEFKEEELTYYKERCIKQKIEIMNLQKDVERLTGLNETLSETNKNLFNSGIERIDTMLDYKKALKLIGTNGCINKNYIDEVSNLKGILRSFIYNEDDYIFIEKMLRKASN